MSWNAAHYLKYGDERTRPSCDLVARIQLNAPQKIVDLGCGPGNSTQVVRSRWPSAEVIGVDNSPAMIEAARKSYPDQAWLLADATTWTPAAPVDLVFSNAALQWLPHHAALVPRLFSFVAPGGALAFQIPSGNYATIRRLVFEVSHDPTWDDRMEGARRTLTMESPAFYYDALCRDATQLDIWETEYQHVLDSRAAIVDWIAGTGLRPFLAALRDDGERTSYLSKLQRRVDESYDLRADGKALFPFLRTFVVAYR